VGPARPLGRAACRKHRARIESWDTERRQQEAFIGRTVGRSSPAPAPLIACDGATRRLRADGRGPPGGLRLPEAAAGASWVGGGRTPPQGPCCPLAARASATAHSHRDAASHLSLGLSNRGARAALRQPLTHTDRGRAHEAGQVDRLSIKAAGPIKHPIHYAPLLKIRPSVHSEEWTVACGAIRESDQSGGAPIHKRLEQGAGEPRTVAAVGSQCRNRDSPAALTESALAALAIEVLVGPIRREVHGFCAPITRGSCATDHPTPPSEAGWSGRRTRSQPACSITGGMGCDEQA
jgi:hypothetical protein